MKQFNNGTIGKGFTLLEVIIAIFIVTVGIISTLLLITRTLAQTSISFSQLTAAYLTQEGIEIVRNIRDTNWIELTVDPNPPNSWDEGLTGCSTGCEADYIVTSQLDPTLSSYAGTFLKIDGNGFYNYTSDTPTKFKRKITINPDPGGDILKVTVLVMWAEKGQTFYHTAQENLYRWR